MRYVLIGLLGLLVLQGCSTGSGGSTVSSAVQGQSRNGSEGGGGDHGGGHSR
jgi:hypothetical protein